MLFTNGGNRLLSGLFQHCMEWKLRETEGKKIISEIKLRDVIQRERGDLLFINE